MLQATGLGAGRLLAILEYMYQHIYTGWMGDLNGGGSGDAAPRSEGNAAFGETNASEVERAPVVTST